MSFLNKHQTNYHFKHSILVNNSKEKIWNYLIDVSRWKEWDSELNHAEISGSFVTGTSGILVPKKGPKLKFYLSEIIPNKSYTFVTKMPVGALVIQRILEENEQQIRFTDNIQFTGFLKRTFGILLGKGFRAVLPKVMQQFSELAEKE